MPAKAGIHLAAAPWIARSSRAMTTLTEFLMLSLSKHEADLSFDRLRMRSVRGLTRDSGPMRSAAA